jgi:hypothetical protein
MLLQRREDEGAALVLALLIIVFVAVVGVAALGYSNTSLRVSNRAIRPARSDLYTAEASTQAAIRYVKNNWFAGQALGVGCSTYTYDQANNVATQICPVDGSFNTNGQPQAALLILGSQGLVNTSQGTLSVVGNVWSGGPITLTAANTNLRVQQGQVFARGACDLPKITMDPGWPAPSCNYGGPAGSLGTDPNYSPVTTTLSPGGGSCDPVTNTATVTPGSFNQVQWDFIVGTCANIWLRPDPGGSTNGAASAYYFDNVVLDVHQNRLVAGTLSAGVTPANLSAATYPGLCDPTQLGVQLVFGGASQISMGSQSVLELCGFNPAQRGGANAPRIVIYGIKQNTGGLPASTSNIAPTIVSDVGAAAWTAPISNAIAFDGVSTTAAPAGGSTASLQFSGFGLAAQSVVSALSLDVTHTEDTSAASVTAVVSDAFGPGCTLTFSNPGGNNPPTTYNHEVKSCPPGLSLSGPSLKVTWSVKAKNGNAISNPAIDGIAATITSSVPPLTQLAGTFMTSNGQAAKMHIVGSVYIPTVGVNLQVPNISEPAITDSLVVDHASMVIATGSIAPSIGGGGASDVSVGDVIFRTSVGGKQWISARVSYPSGLANNSSSGDPTITSWVVQR